jgi:hypothetical protein
MRKIYLLVILIVIISQQIKAWNNPNKETDSKTNSNNSFQLKAANCAPASTYGYLEFNNVRALIETGGSMWQNRSTSAASYEVPAGSGEMVVYSGALWMGGVDVNNQLKLAALTFRQGNDFWTGPLSVTPGSGNPAISIKDYGAATIDPETCLEYDKFHITTRQEVMEFKAWWECTHDPDCNDAVEYEGYSVPNSILNWPAHGDIGKFQDFYLAPFYDRDGEGSGIYRPLEDGDYPWYDLDNEVDCLTDRRVTLFGDYNMWWVFNDKGNIHTETNGDPIGMEIRAQAFAFATNDEINNMTFYNYEMINRSTQTLTNTHFAVWMDSDIGCSGDDFTGCDVQRGLGYMYNGDAIDDKDCNGSQPIGANPPAVGVDFFEGPYQDNDGLDNPLTPDISQANIDKGIPYEGIGIGYGDNVIDNERFGMRRFGYFVIGNGVQGDPGLSIDYYNYMLGFWKDGTQFTYGGDGHGGTLPTDYCFPDDTDPLGWGQDGTVMQPWSEVTEGNFVGDRRFYQAAGPFTLQPGAVNNITFGVVYGKSMSGDPFESVELVRKADDKAQALFDNCFQILEGPPAPSLAIQELENELIVFLEGTDEIESYQMVDPLITAESKTDSIAYDSLFTFQGYQVFQMLDATVDVSELNDVDRARLVAQCDIKDGVGQLINFTFNEDIGANEAIEMVDGEDKGIKHSFRFLEDQFAHGDKKLINHKKYYYMALSYGYNNYLPFDGVNGQDKPYLGSRLSVSGTKITSFVGIPHSPSPEIGGTIQNSQYGDGPQITRVEGRGNGGNVLELTEESEADIVANYTPKEVTYAQGSGPIEIKVIDPLNVVGGDYRITFVKDANTATLSHHLDSATWYLVNLENTDDTLFSRQTIELGSEQLIPELGISINIQQYQYGVTEVINSYPNPFLNSTKHYTTELLHSSMEFADSSKRWLAGVEDRDGITSQNWIRSGTASEEGPNLPDGIPEDDLCAQNDLVLYNDYVGMDDLEIFENVVGGTWAPFKSVALGKCKDMPVNSAQMAGGLGLQGTHERDNKLTYVSSVDIVITSDKSNWTRCVVLESQDNSSLSWDGATEKLNLKKKPSLDKYGNPDGTGVGMSWFPGYAIDLESGERLNMAFAEDSWLGNEGGKDMIFNPSANMRTGFGDPLFGGKHYVYVFKNQRKEDKSFFFSQDRYMPAYDEAVFMKSKMGGNGSDIELIRMWKACMWVGIPMLSETAKGLADESDPFSYIETDVKIKIRVGNQYERHSPTTQHYTDTTGSINNWYPVYDFNMDDLATTTSSEIAADSALALINVVPNPYYAYSNYESNRLESLVKIVNLPDVCTIKIYTVNGTLVRTFKKDNLITHVEWNLKNHANIPISSGLYLIHVDVPGVGERVMKWFGMVRPPDLDNF